MMTGRQRGFASDGPGWGTASALPLLALPGPGQ